MSSPKLKSNRTRTAATVAAAAACAALTVSGSVRAATIAYWNFNDATGNTANWLAVDAGSGTMAVTSSNPLTSTTGTTVNAVGATVAGNAIGFESKSNVASPNYTWAASTAGLNDIWFSFASNNAAAAYTTMQVSYSTDGTNFTNLASQTPPGSFAATQADLSGIAALNNNANAKFRLTLSGGSSGNNKFFYIDNVQINSGNDSQLSGGNTISLGRVVQGGTGAQNYTFAKNGVVATTYTATGSAGLGITADGSVGSGTQTESISVGLQNNAAGSATTGLKSYSFTIDNTAGTSFGAGLGSADADDTVNVSGTVVANRVVTATDVNLGRVMVGQSLAGNTTNLSTTGDDNNFSRVTVGTTAAADANGVTITGGTGTLFNGAASIGSRSVGGSFSTSGLKSGSRTLTTTGEGLAGEAPVNVVVNYTGTALANRLVTASTINFGTLIVGGSVADTSSLSTTLDDDNATRVSVATTAGPDSNGISVTGGTGTFFNGAASTGTRSLGGTITTAGTVSGSLTLATTGEGLAGEAPVNVSVAYNATALDHSNGSFATPADTDTIVIDFGSVAQNSVQSLPFSIHNLVATAGFTAGLDLDSILGTDLDGVFSTDLATFANLAAGGSSAYGVTLDTTNVGTFSGSYVLSLSDQDLAGATGGQTLTINVVGEVVPEPASFALIGAAAAIGLPRARRRHRSGGVSL
jgi:hypothetical protein